MSSPAVSATPLFDLFAKGIGSALPLDLAKECFSFIDPWDFLEPLNALQGQPFKNGCLELAKIDAGMLDRVISPFKNNMEILEDKAWVVTALKVAHHVSCLPHLYSNIYQRYSQDLEVLRLLVKADPRLLSQIPDTQEEYQKLCLIAIEKDLNALKRIREGLKNNPDFMLAAIQVNPNAILVASNDLRSNKEFMIKTFPFHEAAYLYANSSLFKDAEFMSKATQHYGQKAAQYANRVLQQDQGNLCYRSRAFLLNL